MLYILHTVLYIHFFLDVRTDKIAYTKEEREVISEVLNRFITQENYFTQNKYGLNHLI